MLPSPNLKAWYPLQRDGGMDRSGNGNHLTTNDGATFDGGAPNGGGWKFSPPGTRIYSDSINFSISGISNTICLWYRRDGDGGGGLEHLIGWRSGGSYRLWDIATSGLAITNQFSSPALTMAGAIPAGAGLHHLAFVVSPSGSGVSRCTSYVDGMIIGTSADFDSSSYPTWDFTRLWIGGDYVPSVIVYPWNGMLADLQFWSVALPQGDILAIMNGFNPKTA